MMTMVSFFVHHAPLLRSLWFFEPTPYDVFVFFALGEKRGRLASCEPWLGCRAGELERGGRKSGDMELAW